MITVAEAHKELHDCLLDLAQDRDLAVIPDDFVVDLLTSLAIAWPAEVAQEVCRVEVGWVPAALLVARPDIRQLPGLDQEGCARCGHPASAHRDRGGSCLHCPMESRCPGMQDGGAS